MFSKMRNNGVTKCIYCGREIIKCKKTQIMCGYCHIYQGYYDLLTIPFSLLHLYAKHVDIPKDLLVEIEKYETVEGFTALHSELLTPIYNIQIKRSELKCKFCGKLIGENNASQVSRWSSQFCSEVCHQRNKLYKDGKRKCIICGKEIPYGSKQKACSVECKRIRRNETHRVIYDRNKPMYNRICPVCGKNFATYLSRSMCCCTHCNRLSIDRRARARKREERLKSLNGGGKWKRKET